MTSAALVSARIDDPPAHVTKLLLENPIHHVLVLDGGRLTGIVTARDLLALQDGAPLRDAIGGEPVIVSVDDSVHDAAKLLTDHSIHFLPVVDGEAVVGVVSSTDVLRFVLGA